MKTIEIQLYGYDELSDDAKVKALEDFIDGDYYHFEFLEEDLTEYLKQLLEEKGIKGEAELNYSLSYSQGDGVCFMGNFEYKNIPIRIFKNSNQYSHSNTTTIEAENFDDGDELKADFIEKFEADFKELYDEICDKIEEYGYKEIEYQQSEENFKGLCEANECTFEANGTMRNI